MRTRTLGHRLREGRWSEAGRVYLLTAVTDGRCPVFSDWRLGRLLVHEMRGAHEQGLVSSLAWVVMPDHVHWLIELRECTLGELMCRVKSRSSLTISLARQGQGRLWQKGYHDRALRTEDNLKHAARYVVANPLRAGLVERLGDYPLWDAIWL
ncbi:transposase [Pseudomonas sp. SWI44]|uniref:REP-associated tyrosine transposase n=1 Tax=Pseudomonas sp. SWI44 TaxID=2083053 RepID=UPI000CE5D8A2|nr:transposase [Pseudomonas sp. SWI44]AVD89972.1 transposase [Pseudomonas sp. SWI44]